MKSFRDVAAKFRPVKELHRLAADGDAAGVAKQLERGANADARDILGLAPIHYAARVSYGEVIGHLLDHGADPNAETPEGDTALFNLAERGEASLVSTLLDRGARAGHANRDGNFPLMIAVAKGHRAVAKALLDHGAEADQQDANGRTALRVAVEQGFVLCTRLLLENGSSPSASTEEGKTLLAIAMEKANAEIGVLLQGNGARIGETPEDGAKALIQAVLFEKVEWTKILLRSGADPHAKVETTDIVLQTDQELAEKTSAFELAKVLGKIEFARAIESFEAEASEQEAVKTAVHQTDNMRDGTDAARPEPAENGEDEKPAKLLEAIIEGDTARVLELLTKRPELVNVHTNKNGWTPLLLAVGMGDRTMVKLLLQHSADIDTQSKRGKAPVHQAAGQGDLEMLELLLAHKPDISVKYRGRTPLQRATKATHTKAAELLKDYESAF